jgi:hypothetical protein
MKGDFSRDTYDRTKHFSRVLQQQGRVQLDADWNEQTAILIHYMRTLAADLIGPFAGPQGSSGFEITTPAINDFTIGKGRYYVDGILCENELATSYKEQKDFLRPLKKLEAGAESLVYLDVWERHITALEDDYIREKALVGGPDTATRTKVVWQVKTDDGKRNPFDSPPTKLTPDGVRSGWENWIERWQPKHLGCLKARVDRPEDSKDPCLTAPDAKYRGQENQLYRVEIHKDGMVGEATFKWSRDNGAVVSRVTLSGAELVVEKPLGFDAGNWVELINDGQELRGERGTLVRLLKVEGNRFTLESTPVVSEPTTDKDWPTKVRRWDQRETGSPELEDGAVLIKESGKEHDGIELENGIQIQFMPAKTGEAHHYRTGDYWLIPARVATGDIEWPLELDPEGKPDLDLQRKVKPIPQPPYGIRHHYAPLAILNKEGKVDADCRSKFDPLNVGLTGEDKMPSSGIDGIGGPPSCGTTTLRQASRTPTKSRGVDDSAALRRGKPK